MASYSFHYWACVVGSGVLVLGGCGEPPSESSGAAESRQALETPWTQQAKLVASPPVEGTRFGSGYGQTLAISGDTAVIGAVPNSRNDEPSVYVVERSGLVWSERQIISGSGEIFARFGGAVAVAGETIVVGSPGEDNSAGAARVFVRSGAQWTLQQRLARSPGTFRESFGHSLAIDGDTMVIGTNQSWYQDEAVYVYVRSGSSWSEQQTLRPSDPFVFPEDRDWFGGQVALSGETIAVLASGKDAVYFFVRNGSQWSEQQKLTLPFPNAVALSGNTALVSYDGKVGVFERQGSTFSQTQTLIPSQPPDVVFSASRIALSADHALFSGWTYKPVPDPTTGQPVTYLPRTGFLYQRSGADFSEIQRLSLPNPRVQDFFAESLALSADTALVGAPGMNVPNTSAAGAVFVFTAPPSTAPVASSPSGPSATNWPTYRFTRVVGATHYRIAVANVFEQVFTAAEAHCATEVEFCTVRPASALPQGESTWQARAESAGGLGPWSNTLTISVAEASRAPSSAPTVIAPTGAIASTTPTYRWNAVPMATQYTLWVNDLTASGTPLRTVLEVLDSAELGCEAGGVCSVTPAKALAYGAAKWWVVAQNPLGSGAWSPAANIVVTPPPPSLAPVPIAPIGQIAGGSAISYSFGSVPFATDYHLWVNDNSGTRFQRTYSAESAGCTAGGTCTLTPIEPVGIGLRTWWVRAQNSSGHTAWSAAASFTIGGGSPPGVPTLLSPSGSTTSSTPTYTWSAVTDATKYLLWVNDSQGQRLVRYYTAEAAECADGTCAVTPEVAVALGSAIWWLQAANDAGPGAWVSLSFTVVAP